MPKSILKNKVVTRRSREISKNILNGLLMAGGFAIACSSPNFARRAVPLLVKHIKYKLNNRKQKQNFSSTFYYLRKKGLIDITYLGKQIHISLTKEGRRLANKYQIDDIKITKPKKWDQRWRILIFDIPDKHKIKREALRGKLKELNLYQLQKSVWVCPYDFTKEVELLRNFFAFSEKEMKVIIATSIQNDEEVRHFFKLTQ